MAKSLTRIELKELNDLADEISDAISTTRDNVSATVIKFAYLLDKEAKELISSSHGSGKIRGIRTVSGNRRTGKGRRTLIHQSSAPGEAPVTDTGRLVSSIRPAFYGLFAAEVGSLNSIAKYGSFLEDGTKNVEARPWLEPTLKNNHSQLSRILDASIKTGGLTS